MPGSDLIGVALPPQQARASQFQTVVMTLDRAWGDALAEALRARGVPTLVPPNAARWLRQSDPGEPNCIVLDLDHGGPGALELLQEIAAGPALSIIVAAASAPTIKMVVGTVRVGAHDFINKRFDVRQVCDQVQLAGEHLLDQREQQRETLEHRERIATLTKRERDILHEIAAGLTTKQIAFKMEISPRTVQVFRDSVRKRLAARSLEEALGIWIQFGEKRMAAAA